jgi:hypothetical protein
VCHGNKRNPETVRIAFCWETQIVCSHLPLSAGGSIERNTSFTGHGKKAVTSYVGSMSRGRHSLYVPEVAGFQRASTGPIADSARRRCWNRPRAVDTSIITSWIVKTTLHDSMRR